jgi:hypothetical protein
MGQAVKDLRDYLSLARVLRRFVDSHPADANHDLFVTTATALEARARFLAQTHRVRPEELRRDVALHAPVNLVI